MIPSQSTIQLIFKNLRSNYEIHSVENQTLFVNKFIWNFDFLQPLTWYLKELLSYIFLNSGAHGFIYTPFQRDDMEID